MSIQTKLSILRRDDKIVLSDNDKKEIEETKATYEKDYKELIESRKRLSKEFKGLNYDESKEEKLVIPEFIFLDKYHYVNSKDNSIWTVVYDEYFLSSFSELAEHVGLTMEGERGQYFISEKEAEDIRSAAKYLTHGNYDDELEGIINSEYIEVFGDLIPSYRNRHKKNKKSMCLFIDRESEDSWKITDGNDEWDDCDRECEDEGVGNLNSLAYIMGLYLHELFESKDYHGKKNTDVRLMLNYT